MYNACAIQKNYTSGSPITETNGFKSPFFAELIKKYHS